MIVGLQNNTHLNGVCGRVTGQAAMRRNRPLRWCFKLSNQGLFDGKHAEGVEVKTENIRMMTIDRQRTQDAGTLWLYSMDESITPSEFFIKILQHYEMYQPAFLDETEYSFRCPFIQAMVDIMMPWERKQAKETLSSLKLAKSKHSEYLQLQYQMMKTF